MHSKEDAGRRRCGTHTGVVGKRPFKAIKDEPALLPGFDLPSHLDKIALAHLFGENHVVARVHAVT